MSEIKYRYGFRNNYRSSMPLTEMWLKDITDFFTSLRYRIFHSGQLPTIVAYPDYPSKRTTLYKIAKNLKFRLTNKPVEADLVIYFEDITLGSTQAIERYYGNRKIINGKCIDISKKKVEEAHQKIFGYTTAIDPTIFEGHALAKSDENAKHDGVVIQCPIAQREEGKVYQIIIDNTHSNGDAVDMRVPVYGNTIPLVYRKYKKPEVRFTNEVHRTTLHPTESLFNEVEQSLIVKFAREMGADWCELDILRDNKSGQIYIVDLNKTAYGPPAELNEQEEAIAILTKAFKQEWLSNQQ
jgi:hypothetical protein